MIKFSKICPKCNREIEKCLICTLDCGCMFHSHCITSTNIYCPKCGIKIRKEIIRFYHGVE